MKYKVINKILIPCAVAQLCAASFVCCGTRSSEDGPYEEMAKILYEDVKKEFLALSMPEREKEEEWETFTWTRHRSTFDTLPFIRDYLKPRINEIMEKEMDFKDVEYDPGEEHKSERLGYNFYFDIPANNMSGHNVGAQLPPIIIQCHTDMVWKCDTSEEAPNDSPAINVVSNWAQNTFYTAPYRSETVSYGKTTLGADNGIGIATILSLCKHQKEFNHGIIRCLFTTDEEDGPSGASALKDKPEVFQVDGNQISYCLNIDLEDNHIMARSCGGTQTATWTLEYSGTESPIQPGYKLVPVAADSRVYQLDITGLLGGHSGLDINKNRINAAKFAAEMLSAIDYDGSVRLVSFSTNSDETDTSLYFSSIPNQAHIVFATDLDYQKTNEKVQQVVASARMDHPSENKFQCNLTELSNSFCTTMNWYDTNRFINFLSEVLTFGPISFLESGAVQSCANIGTTLFRPNSDTWEEEKGQKAVIALQGRSSDIEQLGESEQGDQPEDWKGFLGSFFKKSKQVFGVFDDTTAGIKFDSWTPPWAPRDDDKLQSVVLASANYLGQSIKPSDEPGWLEVAYFLQAEGCENLNIACIGPKIDNAHSTNETLHTDSIVPMLRLLLCTLDNLPTELKMKGGNVNG